MERFKKYPESEYDSTGCDSIVTDNDVSHSEDTSMQKLSIKEMTANIQALKSYLQWQKDDPDTPVENLVETENAIARANFEIQQRENDSRAEALAKWGYTGYED